MSFRLSDLRDSMEGVIPSIIATSSADGVPNWSTVRYLKLVELVSCP